MIFRIIVRKKRAERPVRGGMRNELFLFHCAFDFGNGGSRQTSGSFAVE